MFTLLNVFEILCVQMYNNQTSELLIEANGISFHFANNDLFFK